MSDCQRCELLRKMAADLLSERDEARAIAHGRALDQDALDKNDQYWDALQFIKNAECIETARKAARRALEPKP